MNSPLSVIPRRNEKYSFLVLHLSPCFPYPNNPNFHQTPFVLYYTPCAPLPRPCTSHPTLLALPCFTLPFPNHLSMKPAPDKIPFSSPFPLPSYPLLPLCHPCQTSLPLPFPSPSHPPLPSPFSPRPPFSPCQPPSPSLATPTAALYNNLSQLRATTPRLLWLMKILPAGAGYRPHRGKRGPCFSLPADVVPSLPSLPSPLTASPPC